jgi:hypothetical protein
MSIDLVGSGTDLGECNYMLSTGSLVSDHGVNLGDLTHSSRMTAFSWTGPMKYPLPLCALCFLGESRISLLLYLLALIESGPTFVRPYGPRVNPADDLHISGQFLISYHPGVLSWHSHSLLSLFGLTIMSRKG